MHFSVVATVSGIPDRCHAYDLCYNDCKRAFEASGLAMDETEPGDSAYSYLAEEDGTSEFWQEWGEKVQDLTASGIIKRSVFTELVKSLGAYAEDVETLGTLGGPLGLGLVADIVFEVESQEVIVSMRVTPIPCHPVTGEFLTGNKLSWPRIRKAMLAVYGC